MSILPRPERFSERQFLGRGASGDVYLVWDHQRSEEIALKIVRKISVDPDLLVAERNGAKLQQELSRIAAQVPKVEEINEDAEFLWVVMEYVKGNDLSQILATGPLPEVRAILIAIQLCDLLNRLHNHTTVIGGRKILGVVHGDIKPENIRLLSGDEIRLLDFGIAKQLSLSRSFTTSLFGSLPYVPPERLERGELDSLSDLWATGVVLYFMVSGHLPFAGETPKDVEMRVLRGELLPLPDSCSRPLRWVVYKSLSLDPGRRFLTAKAMQADLEAVLEGRLEGMDELASEQVNLRSEALTGLKQNTARESGKSISDATRPVRRTIDPIPRPTTKHRSNSKNQFKWLLALLAISAILIAPQFYVWREMEAIRHDLTTGTADDIGLIFDRYEKVHSLSLFDLGLDSTSEEITAILNKSADRVFASYRGDDPRIPREDWEEAAHYIESALKLDGSDQENRARLAYCQGHLALADSKAAKERGALEAAQERRKEAVAEFQEAAALSPTWPDPYLGLARIYVYEHTYQQFDIEKLENALQNAERRGYHDNRRLNAMRADGHLNEGRRLYSESFRIRGGSGEEKILKKALTYFEQAIVLYDQIPGYANVSRNRLEAIRQAELIEGRLDTLYYDEYS